MAQPSTATRAQRRRLREARLAVNGSTRRRAETSVAKRLESAGLADAGHRVAVYLAMPGELSLEYFIRRSHRRGVDLYAPKIISFRRRSMGFVPLAPDAVRQSNRLGIQEPAAGINQRIAPNRLDAVLVPMLGFDRTGHRLGMGAGFYDRALRMRRDPARRWRRPRLIGIAFACQQVDSIAASPWDVAMDLIVTERETLVGGHNEYREEAQA